MVRYKFEYLHYANNGISVNIPASWTESANRMVIQSGSYADLDNAIAQLAGRKIIEARAETFLYATNLGPYLFVDKTKTILGDGLAPSADFVTAIGNIPLTGLKVLPVVPSVFFNLSVIVSFDPVFVKPGVGYTYDVWHHLIIETETA